MPTMHTSLDAKPPSEEDRTSKRPSEIRQTTSLLDLLLAGRLISLLVVRYISPRVPKGAGMYLLRMPAMTRAGALLA